MEKNVPGPGVERVWFDRNDQCKGRRTMCGKRRG